MFGIVKVGDTDVPMCANAATPIRYRQVFKKNLLPYFMGQASDEDAAEMIGELAYIMTRAAEKADMSRLNFDDYVVWLEGFGPLDFSRSETAAAIIDLYQGNTNTLTEVKKNQDEQSGK